MTTAMWLSLGSVVIVLVGVALMLFAPDLALFLRVIGLTGIGASALLAELSLFTASVAGIAFAWALFTLVLDAYDTRKEGGRGQ